MQFSKRLFPSRKRLKDKFNRPWRLLEVSNMMTANWAPRLHQYGGRDERTRCRKNTSTRLSISRFPLSYGKRKLSTLFGGEIASRRSSYAGRKNTLSRG